MDESVFQAFLPELVDIRRRLHQMPETGYEERQTSALVADLMEGRKPAIDITGMTLA